MDSIAGPVAEGSVSTWAVPTVYEVFVSGVVVVSGREMGSEGSVLYGEEKFVRKGSRVEVVEG